MSGGRLGRNRLKSSREGLGQNPSFSKERGVPTNRIRQGREQTTSYLRKGGFHV